MPTKSWQQLQEDAQGLDVLIKGVFVRTDRADFETDENLRHLIGEVDAFEAALVQFQADLNASAPALRSRGYHTRIDRFEALDARLAQQLLAVRSLAEQAKVEISKD